MNVICVGVVGVRSWGRLKFGCIMTELLLVSMIFGVVGFATSVIGVVCCIPVPC